MKKAVVILVISSLFFAQISYSASPDLSLSHKNDVFRGVVAGMVATWGVEISREYILPDMDSFKLHDNYGICRDQLQGKVGVAAATLGLAAVEESSLSSVKKTLAQIGGILIGGCLANYISKLAK